MKLSRRKRENVKLFRIARSNDAWEWVDWVFARDSGRFDGRFDDPERQYRMLYAGTTLRGCLLEVLAHFRPDPAIEPEMADIIDDPEDTPATLAGHIGHEWARDRQIGTARATAHTCVVADSKTIAWLRTTLQVGTLDAAALKDAGARDLTQKVSRLLYEKTNAPALEYRSRHGEEEKLWAIYERDEGALPDCLSRCETLPFEPIHPDVLDVFELYGLTWKAPDARRSEDMPAPIVGVSVDEFYAQAFAETGGIPLPSTPVGCVWLWLNALNDRDERATKAVTHQPENWRDKDWQDARRMQGKATAFIARTIPVANPSEIPSNIAEAVHVPLAVDPVSGVPEGAYRTFGPLAEDARLVYVTVLKVKGSPVWRVTGMGREAPMPTLLLNGPAPRVAQGDVARYHLDQIVHRLKKLDS